MNKTSLFSAVSLTFDEVMELNVLRTNRFGYLNKDEGAKENIGSVNIDFAKFEQRAKKIAKLIKDNGFNDCSLFIIAKHKDDGKLYIIDGQGRRKAIDILVKENTDSSILYNLKNRLYNAVIYNEPVDEAKMFEMITGVNTGNSNFSTRDKIRSEALHEGGEKQKLYEEIKEFEEKYDLVDKTHISTILFCGQNISHAQSNGIQFKRHKNYKLYTDAYAKFVSYSDYKTDACDERGKVNYQIRRNFTRSVDLACSWHSVLTRIINYYGNDENICKNMIDEYVKLCVGYIRYCDDLNYDSDQLRAKMRIVKKTDAFIAQLLKENQYKLKKNKKNLEFINVISGKLKTKKFIPRLAA